MSVDKPLDRDAPGTMVFLSGEYLEEMLSSTGGFFRHRNSAALAKAVAQVAQIGPDQKTGCLSKAIVGFVEQTLLSMGILLFSEEYHIPWISDRTLYGLV